MARLRFVLGLVLLGMLALTSCGLNEFKKQEDRLKSLLARKVPKSEAMSVLGTNFIYYSKGQSNWNVLIQVLSREPVGRMVAVRKKVAEWPNVMLYSTPDMMTWLFLDANEQVADFVVGAQ